ncbi:MAG: hypothetical protein MJZ64_01405 [Paludibacteraceae bacterium]|nr:hypothetical protein [Paludibacteraceae bacterium]
MIGTKILKWIIAALCVGLVGYTLILLKDANGHVALIKSDVEKKEYVTAPIDTAIQVLSLKRTDGAVMPVEDSMPMRNFPITTTITADSDSVSQVDLYRYQQEAVNIDLEEHKEPVFFTWEDIKVYFRLSCETIKNFYHKIF